MYVCLCSGITDKQIREAIKNGAESIDDLSSLLGVGIQCGSCVATAFSLIASHKPALTESPSFYEVSTSAC